VNDALSQLLQNPRIWRGQQQFESPAWQGLATGYPRLDCHLPGGGWPRHALTEILLDHYGTGELQLVMPALVTLSRDAGSDVTGDAANGRAGWVVWVAPPFTPYPPALVQWGIKLSHVLIVRPKKNTEILWAAEQALSFGNCAAVLLWPDSLDDAASRRLQLAAEKGQSWAVAFRPASAAMQASAAALRIRIVAGMSGSDLRILKSRGGRPALVQDYAAAPQHPG
jgi:hypothetical protein